MRFINALVGLAVAFGTHYAMAQELLLNGTFDDGTYGWTFSNIDDHGGWEIAAERVNTFETLLFMKLRIAARFRVSSYADRHNTLHERSRQFGCPRNRGKVRPINPQSVANFN